MAALRDTLVTGISGNYDREESSYELRFNDPTSKTWIETGLAEFFLYNDEMTVVLPFLAARDITQLMYCSKDFYMRFAINDVWCMLLERDFRHVVLAVPPGIAFPLELIKNDKHKYPDRLLRLKRYGEYTGTTTPEASDVPQHLFTPPENQELMTFESPAVLLQYEFDRSALPLAVKKMRKSKKAGQSVVNRLLGDVQEVLRADSDDLTAPAEAEAKLQNDSFLTREDTFKIETLKSVFKQDQCTALDYYYRFVATLSFPYTHYAFTKTVGTDVTDASVFSTMQKAANVEGYYEQFSQHFPDLLRQEAKRRGLLRPNDFALPLSYKQSCKDMVEKELTYMRLKAQLDRTFSVFATFAAVCGLGFAIRWLNGQQAFDDYLNFKLVTSQFQKLAVVPATKAATSSSAESYDLFEDATQGAKLLAKNTGRMILEVGWWVPFAMRSLTRYVSDRCGRKKAVDVLIRKGGWSPAEAKKVVSTLNDKMLTDILEDTHDTPVSKQAVETKIEHALYHMESATQLRALRPLFFTTVATTLAQFLLPETYAKKSWLLSIIPTVSLGFSVLLETEWHVSGTKGNIDACVTPRPSWRGYWTYMSLVEQVFFLTYIVDKAASVAVCYRYGMVPMLGFSGALAIAKSFY